MNTVKMMLSAVMLAGLVMTGVAKEEPVVVSDLVLAGEIEGENIIFNLCLKAEVNEKGARLPLVVGDVAYLDGKLPRGAELKRIDNTYYLEFESSSGFFSSGKHSIEFKFASRANKNAEWRQTSFNIPSTAITKLSVLCDRDDLEIRFPGALNIERKKTDQGKAMVTAYLGLTSTFAVNWKPEVKRLDSDLVTTCDANTIATASVGALRLDTIFTYRIIQGEMIRLSMALPDVNVTQVRGDDIQEWHIDRTVPDSPKLLVTLSRPQEGTYKLQVESEMILPEFPCDFDLPVLAPQDVIRTSGFVMIGTDSAIKLQVSKAGGLTQVDQAAFPVALMESAKALPARPKPSRSAYAYQYANTPYTLSLGADDIVTSLSADNRLVLSLMANEAIFDASVEVQVKDAPAREILIEIDPEVEWTVTSITGNQVSEADADVRMENVTESGQTRQRRVIYVPFKQAVSGTALITIRMEKSLPRDVKDFGAPVFTVLDSKVQRGYLVIAAERGVRLKATEMTGVREVFTGSAPMQVPGAQQAFRFKNEAWRLKMAVDRSISSIHSELFHLVSLGEGVSYCSSAITYHIGGAPVQEFMIRVPKEIEVVEFTGADIEGWTRDGDVCTVRLQTRIIGDYTLLVTYDTQFSFEAAGGDIAVGVIETLETESESGYIAISSSASLTIAEPDKMPDSIIKISRDEIPPEYAGPIADPIISSYKYVRVPHTALLRVKPHDTAQLLGQIADYVNFSTTISKDGESVTTATYYLKNVSRQYLVLSLPRNAELWSIVEVNESGKKEVLPSQESDAGILIPVKRPRDPNTSMHIEIVYAESRSELGFWRSGLMGMRFEAPRLPDTHATFANWKINVPGDFAIADVGGNMLNAGERNVTGFKEMLRKAWGLLIAVLDGPGNQRLSQVLSNREGVLQAIELTRTVNFIGESPLSIRLSVVPLWMGSLSSARIMIMACFAGLVLLAAGFTVLKKRLVYVLGMTSLVFGLSQGSLGRNLLSVALAGYFVYLFARFMRKYGFKLIRGVARYIWKLFKYIGSFLRLLVRGIWFVIRTVFRHVSLLLVRISACRPRLCTAQGPVPGPAPFEPVENAEDMLNELLKDVPEDKKGDEIIEDESEEGNDDKSNDDKRGFASTRILALLSVLMFAVMALFASPEVQSEKIEAVAPYVPVMELVTITAEGPGTDRDEEKSALVTRILEFEAEAPCEFIVVPSTSVLTEYDLSSRKLAIRASADGYILKVEDKGKYKVKLVSRVPVTEEPSGEWKLCLPMQANMRNNVSLTLPVPGMEIRCEEGVLFKSTETEKITKAEVVFGPTKAIAFTWRPRVRKTKLEKSVVFCELQTLVAMKSGVVDVTSLVRYQIAQGELKELKIKMPAGMSVTAVQAPGLATWSFDPATRVLEAILETPVSKEFVLTLGAQIACDGLPYTTSIGVPEVVDAMRQRGSVAFAAPDDVQLRVIEPQGLTPMNIEDFSSTALQNYSAAAQAGKGRVLEIRRAFRYHKSEDVLAKVGTEKVLPEIRVVEAGALSISDERTVLSTKLTLAILKSGVFFADIEIPDGFDVESLTGNDVSHWDEPEHEAGGEAGWRTVRIHFSRQVVDSTELALVVAQMGRGISEQMVVPRIRVKDVRRHNGRLTISGERGLRMMVESQSGVDIKKASEAGIQQPGIMVLDVLRPNWQITLKTESLSSHIKPEVLQWVDIAEGMLQCRAFIRYKIENAGVKQFKIKAPVPGISLSVTGQNIARVHEVDKEQGIWQVDLHGKVENKFALNVNYQIAYDPSMRGVEILPLNTVSTDTQRGYLVLTCGGRVQVEQVGNLEGLKPEDSRNIPSVFGAGDLSSAIQCYRTIRSDYKLNLSVVRHEVASVLPAKVESVKMTSVLSTGGRMLTKVAMQLQVGDMRFLKMQLPGKEDTLWTVTVNGKQVATSRDGEYYCIPLEEHNDGQMSSVELLYAGFLEEKYFTYRKYQAPRFGLPLNNVQWDFYVNPDSKYYAFGGTMDPHRVDVEGWSNFDEKQYEDYNTRQREQNIAKARTILDTGNQFVREGKQKKAMQAFQQALNYSQGEEGLNEDARVQLRNLVTEQVKSGLVNRRNVLRAENDYLAQPNQVDNAAPNAALQQLAVQQNAGLSADEQQALENVANKIIDQQVAAAGVVTAINVTMPEHGKKLEFFRALQIDPEGELSVSFNVSTNTVTMVFNTIIPVVLLFGFFWIVLRKPAIKAA